jgi:hypothetical protein
MELSLSLKIERRKFTFCTAWCASDCTAIRNPVRMSYLLRSKTRNRPTALGENFQIEKLTIISLYLELELYLRYIGVTFQMLVNKKGISSLSWSQDIIEIIFSTYCAPIISSTDWCLRVFNAIIGEDLEQQVLVNTYIPLSFYPRRGSRYISYIPRRLWWCLVTARAHRLFISFHSARGPWSRPQVGAARGVVRSIAERQTPNYSPYGHEGWPGSFSGYSQCSHDQALGEPHTRSPPS